MLENLHPKDSEAAWDALNHSRVASGLQPHRRPLTHYEVGAFIGLLFTVLIVTLLAT